MNSNDKTIWCTNKELPTSSVIRPAYKGEFSVDLNSPALRSIPRDQILDWCKQSFGPPGRNRVYKWRYNYVETEKSNRIFLRSDEEVMLFKLKWL